MAPRMRVRRLARSIRWRETALRLACAVDRVDGGGFEDVRNALAVEGMGSCGNGRVDQGPRVVIAPVIAMSMAD